MAKTGVIGAGSWGVALAVLLHRNGHEVCVWSRSIQKDGTDRLREKKKQLSDLLGAELPDAIDFTDDLRAAASDKDVLILAVPSPHVRNTAAMMRGMLPEGQIIVSASKGIEESSLRILTDIIGEELPGANAAVLSGPSHAEEVGRGLPTTCVVGARDKETAQYLQNLFLSPVFRVYTSPDMLGIELGGALKNVIALAAGTADGLGCGDNTKAALITRGIAEIARLGIAMGGRAETFYGLTGIGDLIVTCASVHSRNRRAGYLIGQGCSMEEAMAEVKMVVEGVYSAKAALALSQKYGIEMPIVEQVNKVLFEGKNAKDALRELMLRGPKGESGGAQW